jgi:hypothetical protein
MASFGSLFENMDYQKKLRKEQDEQKALEAIQSGLNLDEDFWRDFLLLINNSEALGALLGIRPANIHEWRNRVSKYLRKYYEKEERDVGSLQKKKKFVNTSDYKDFM